MDQINQIKQTKVQRSGVPVYRLGATPTELYSYGDILLVRDDHCVVRVLGGHKITMPRTFPTTIAGTTFVVPDEAGIPVEGAAAEQEQTQEDTAEIKQAAPVRRGRPRDGGETKLSKCRRLFQANRDKPKSEIVALFINEAECTAGGANTYYCLLVKE